MMVAPLESPPREELREQVARAFSSRPYPGDDDIGEHDERYPDYEGDQLSAFLRGKKWPEVTYESLRDHYPGDESACLHFMRDAGFRYYLPAFLLMALDPHARDMAEHLCFVLTDPGDAEATRHERFRARVTPLLSAEKIAVTEVLRFLAKDYEEGGDPINPARAALDSYWERAIARA
jgi:Family of unknown function (DUF6714)